VDFGDRRAFSVFLLRIIAAGGASAERAGK
jgi:hypothetical protein